MRGLIFLLKACAKNRLKTAVKKTITYLITVYALFVICSFQNFFANLGLDTPQGMVTILSAIVVVSVPSNLILYAKRKGLIFNESDVHFVFQAPISPKMVLLNAHLKNIITSFLCYVVIAITGIIYCDVSPLKMIIYFIFMAVMENAMECSMVIILYGNETLSNKTINLMCKAIIAILVVTAAFGIYLFFSSNAGLGTISIFLSHPFVLCIPILGWDIAIIRLIFMGADAINISCTVIYIIFTIVLITMAIKMKCTGEYYEDAMYFANQTAIRRKKNKNGEINLPFKEKLKKASIEYKGTRAKAIYYRQILEYKKHRFFIFGIRTLIFFIIGLIIGIFAYLNYDGISDFRIFIIPAIMAYITFLFSATSNKWMEDLKKPYTFLIPDTSYKKLWYSTKLEHIKAVADGLCMIIPAMFTLKLNLFYVICTLAIFWTLQATKIFLDIITDSLLGNLLGSIGKQFFKMIVEGIIIIIAIFTATGLGVIIDVSAGFLGIIFVMLGMTLILAIIASIAFEKMEMPE